MRYLTYAVLTTTSLNCLLLDRCYSCFRFLVAWPRPVRLVLTFSQLDTESATPFSGISLPY